MPAIITNTQYGQGNLNADISDMRVRLGILPVGTTAGGLPPNKILRYPASGDAVEIYEPIQADLIAALAASDSGDTVWLPSMAIALTAAITVPAGVALIGIDVNAVLNFSSFNGTAITLSTSSLIDFITVNMLSNGATAIGIDASTAGAVVGRHMVVNASNGSATNIAIDTGVSTVISTASEVWIGGKNQSTPFTPFIAWSTDFFVGSPTWNLVPSIPIAINYFEVLIDTGAVYICDSTQIYECLNPKDVTPTWTQIFTPGQVLGGYATLEVKLSNTGSSLAIGARTSSDFWYGEYQSSVGFTWYSIVKGVKDPAIGVGNNVLRTTQNNGPRQEWVTIFNGKTGTTINAFNNSYAGAQNNDSMWRNAVGGHVFVFNYGQDTIPAFTPHWRDATTATEFGSRTATSAIYYNQWIHGAWFGPHLYYVDPDGHLYISPSGLSFVDTYTWQMGFIQDAKTAGGGSLVWLGRLVTGSADLIQISTDHGASWSVKTGNFWSVESGTKLLINLCLVYT